jgi:hypothetical protein
MVNAELKTDRTSRMSFYISPPPRNPLVRALAAIFAVLVLAGAFMLGIVALAVIAGLGLLVWTGAWLRMSWIRRQLRNQAGKPQQGTSGAGADDQVIETEYTIISRNQDS